MDVNQILYTYLFSISLIVIPALSVLASVKRSQNYFKNTNADSAELKDRCDG